MSHKTFLVTAHAVTALLMAGVVFSFQFTRGNTPGYALILLGVAGAITAYATFNAVATALEDDRE